MKILDRSIRLARKIHVCDQQFNVYAFIYNGNKLLSMSRNEMKSTSGKAHFFATKFNLEHTKAFPYKHAEIGAISRLWGRYHISHKETIVVVRLLRNYDLAAAKPCKDCATVIKALGMKVIHT